MSDEIKGTITRVRVNRDEYGVGGASRFILASLAANSWVRDSNTYTYELKVANLLEEDVCTVDVITSNDVNTTRMILDAWSLIYHIENDSWKESGSGTVRGLKFYAKSEPTRNLDIVIKW